MQPVTPEEAAVMDALVQLGWLHGYVLPQDVLPINAWGWSRETER